ncbi:MAG: LysM domain-containing protein [Chloroflexota bacterium]|nr:LysM domain-containing protein [Chloroflexota bacterium]
MRQVVKYILCATIILALTSVVPVQPVSAQEEQDTAVPLAGVVTSTPGQDGIIFHIVKYGETLYTISEAYGVPIDQILRNTGLPLSTTEIRAGQELLIQTAREPSATPTNTPTQDPGTPTPTQPRPTMTPFPTRTPAPTNTPTTPPSMIHRTLGDAKQFGIALILVSGFGMILVIYLGFIKKN